MPAPTNDPQATSQAADNPPAAAPLTLYVVSHTHWDREWYLPFQAFRLKLVRLIDKLLAILETDPAYRHFTLDGQTVVLEDYLEVRPEQAVILRAHIAAGRVLVGPWYILPDEFLVSGESLIRNFLRGHQIAAEFGGVMEVGYTPDPFGHISQLPQVLRGFGIEWAVFWRGIGPDISGTEFLWRAPDGSTVLATRLPDGYSNGLPLSFSLSAARNQVAWLREREAPQCSTAALLVLNGDDHALPSSETPLILETLNAELEEQNVQLVHATLPQYWAAVTDQLGTWQDPHLPARDLTGIPLPAHVGEFREAQNAYLLPGVLSTRMWIKQANYAAETLLERGVEPWEALAWAVDRAQDTVDDERRLHINSLAPLRRTAWKYLLQNQPHDSVCGCSVDAVHDEMKTRYAAVEQLGGALRDDALRILTGFLHTGAAPTGAQQALTVFNALGGSRTDLVQVQIEVTASLQNFRLLDEDGREIPYEVVARTRRPVATFDLDPLTLETALAMAPDGRVLGMAVLDIYMRWTDEAGVVECDITVAEQGEPNLQAIQATADAARRLVATNQVRLFRLRGQHPGHIVARFVARDVPGFGYRTYWVVPTDAALETPPDEGIGLPPDDGRAAGAPLTPPGDPVEVPRPAAIFQPPAEPLPELHEALPGAVPLHPALVTVTTDDTLRQYAVENEFLHVEIEPGTGAVRLTDKEAGLLVTSGNVFVDSGDAGDEYNYCPPPQDSVIEGFDRPPRIQVSRDRLGGQIVVEGELALPAWLSEDRQSRSAAIAQCAVRSVIRLLDGVRRVDIQTTVDNRAGDHRLRVLFEVPVAATYSEAEGAFDVVRRPAGPLPGGETWPERAVATYPQKSFVAVGNGERGLLLANRGLPEFEVQPGGGGVLLALTLIRAVGWLSRDDLTTRPGHAGPGLPTPGGQTFGVQTFEYALVPFAGDWRQSRAYALAHSFSVPLHALTDVLHDGALPTTQALIGCEPPDLILSAVKRSEDGTSLIVRAWNIAADPIDARLTLPVFVRTARRVRLDETDLPADQATLAWTPGPPPAVALRVGPREIVTVRIEV